MIERSETAPWAMLPRRAVFNLTGWSIALLRAPRARLPRPGAGAFAAAVLSVAAIVVLMFLLDGTSSDWARHLPPPFTDVFVQITHFGLSGWFLYPLGAVLLLLAALAPPALPRLMQGMLVALAARCAFLFVAIALPGLFVTVVKRLIGRARPFVVVGSSGHDDPFAFMPFVWRPAYASMPSGHATTAAAAAVAIGAIWPQARGVMWLYALTIMFSRVVILAHHPSDVLAGALVGVVGALMVRRFFAARRIAFSPVDLRPLAGPSWKRLKALARQVLLRP